MYGNKLVVLLVGWIEVKVKVDCGLSSLISGVYLGHHF